MLLHSFVSAIVPSGTNLCFGFCTLAAFQDRCDHSPKCVDVRSGRPLRKCVAFSRKPEGGALSKSSNEVWQLSTSAYSPPSFLSACLRDPCSRRTLTGRHQFDLFVRPYSVILSTCPSASAFYLLKRSGSQRLVHFLEMEGRPR